LKDLLSVKSKDFENLYNSIDNGGFKVLFYGYISQVNSFTVVCTTTAMDNHAVQQTDCNTSMNNMWLSDKVSVLEVLGNVQNVRQDSFCSV